MSAADPEPVAEWVLERRVGGAQELHDAPVLAERRVIVNDVTDTALVLGSTQAWGRFDTDRLAARGVGVARRRSGGGAVLLAPGAQLWVDVTLPAADPRWSDDVGRSAQWLGACWSSAIHEVEPTRFIEVHGAVRPDAAGRAVCFAATGAGEVSVDGAKVVGISQRRTRSVARFQCLVHRHWDAERTLGLLDDADRALVAEALQHRVAGLDRWLGTTGWDPVEALLSHLG